MTARASQRAWRNRAGRAFRPDRRPGIGPPGSAPAVFRRGSTLILVLAILSILILIAATLSYSARLEEISSHNFAEGIQARMAAQTGVGFFFAAMDGRTTSVAALRTPSFASQLMRDYGTARTSGRAPRGRALPWVVPPGAGPGATSAPIGRSDRGFGGYDADFARIGHSVPIATDLAHLHVVDESSKININTMGSWAELQEAGAGASLPPARTNAETAAGAADTALSVVGATVRPVALADALYAVLSSPEVNYRGASPDLARRLAGAILAYRYGPDRQPGRAGVDDDGDGGGSQTGGASRLYDSRGATASGPGAARPLFQLPQAVPNTVQANAAAAGSPQTGGIDEPDEFAADPRLKPYGDDRPFRQVEDLQKVPGITSEIFQALRPYLTVFSASERRVSPDRQARAQVDLNTATPNEIYDQLRAAFPTVPVETLAQYAANLCDYRDADAVPTLVRLEGTQDPILGMEVTPYVTEVWPGPTANPFGDDHGKFIEIYNPYDTAISLSGWTLRLSNHASVPLNSTIIPGGFLIITDDYNGRRDAQAANQTPGYGSFYAIFGLVPNSRNHLLQEAPGLAIPKSNGTVELYDSAGNLVDFFRYGGEATGDLKRSFQRTDPRIRSVQLARCTPYALAAGTPSGDGTNTAGNRLASAEIKNAGFQSALELFAIGSAFAVPGQPPTTRVWRTPQLGASVPDALNERLVDYFTVWNDGKTHSDKGATGLAGGLTTTTLSSTPETLPGPSPLAECGRINLNSAPLPVLRALRGLTGRQIGILLARRETATRLALAGEPLVFGRLSELLVDEEFWGGAPMWTRLNRASQWIGTITFTSNSYLIETENRSASPTGPRLASRSKVESLVSTDGGQNRVVFWRYLE